MSVYLPTSPLKQDIQADQTEFKNLAREGIAQLEAAGVDRRSVSEVRELLDDVLEDNGFWAEQANSLALLVEPVIGGSPGNASEEELAAAARGVLDEVYASELSAIRDRFASSLPATTP